MTRIAFLSLLLAGAASALPQAPAGSAAPPAESRPSSRAAETRPAVVKEHARLGLTINADLLDRTNVARVDNVVPDGPAAMAGIKPGDEIVKVAGVAITNDAVYRRTMAEQKPGTKLAVVIKRTGKEEPLTIDLNGWKKGEPDLVVVQHVLVSFATAKSPSNGAKRTQDEAKRLADEIKQRAIAGDDFGAMVKELTDDPGSKTKSVPGEYRIANTGRPVPAGGMSKDGFIPGFGYLAFTLAVGEVQIVPYDPEISPYGYHVVKRVS